MKPKIVALVVGILACASMPALGQQCRYDIGGWGYGPVSVVKVRGNLGLVASGRVLRVVDVSVPAVLRDLGELELSGVIRGIAFTDYGSALVAAGGGGLWIVDLSDPLNPVGADIGLDGSVVAVVVTANYVYAAAQIGSDVATDFRFSIFDLTEPSTPVVVGSLTAEGSVEEMAVGDESVYLAMADRTLFEIDVSVPQQPSHRVFNGAFTGRPGSPVRVTVGDAAVYLSELSSPLEYYTTIYAITPGSLDEIWSSTSMGRFVNDMECVDEKLVLADGLQGAVVLDPSTSPPPVIGTYQDWSNDIADLEMADGFAYLAGEINGLQIIDASDLTELAVIGVLDLDGLYPMMGMALVDHHLVGTSAGNGLTVVDVVDPARPRLVSTKPTLGLGSSVVASGHHAMVAAGDRGVEIIDLAAPENPVLVATIVTDGKAQYVALRGSHLFVFSDVMEVFEISDPSQPNRVATLAVSGFPHLTGERLLLGAGDGLRIINVADPSAPTLLGWYSTDWLGPGARVSGLTAKGDLAYVASWGSGSGGWYGKLHVLDIADPVAATELDSTDVLGPVFDLMAWDEVLTCGTLYEGIFTFDLSDPRHPIQGRTFVPFAPDEHGWLTRMDIHGFLPSGSMAYTGLNGDSDEFSGLRILDFSDPARPRNAGTLSSPTRTTAVATSDELAVTLEYLKGLRVFDLADPETPRELGFLATSTDEVQIEISGDMAYLAGRYVDFRLIDLEPPSQPEVITEWPVRFNAIDLEDGHLFAVEGEALRIFDIAEPSTPVEISSHELESGESIRSIAVDSGTAAVIFRIDIDSMPFTKTRILDVSDLTAPIVSGMITHPGYPRAVAIAGNYVFIVTNHGLWFDPGLGELYIVDISDPMQPVDLAVVTTTFDAGDVTISDNLAFVSEGDRGVLVLDVSNPAAPVEVRRIDTPGTAQKVVVDGRSLLVADGNGGLTTITNRGCRADLPTTPVATDE